MCHPNWETRPRYEFLIEPGLTWQFLPTHRVEEYSSYFQWLDSQIKRYRNERDQDEPEVARLNIKTYGGFLLLVDFVKASHHVKREDIIERFLEHGPFTDRINNGHIKLQVSERKNQSEAVSFLPFLLRLSSYVCSCFC